MDHSKLADAENARIPVNPSDLERRPIFYICNTFVPEIDGSRIIGPFEAAEITHKKSAYDSLISRIPEEDRHNYPFIIYRLSKIDMQEFLKDLENGF